MHRSQQAQQAPKKHSVRIWGFAIAAIMVATMGAISGSCVLDTKTNFCEQFGLRCKEGQECAANQAVCIDIGGCGNGVVDKGEACDDGNIVDGELDDKGMLVPDLCNHDCTSSQECGNGILDEGEECDHGKLNGARDNTCDVTCHLVSFMCGNNIVDHDQGEQCDPGDNDSEDCNSNKAGTLGCKASKCGDGYPNAKAHEECDSSGINTAQCNGPLCTMPTCGDNFTNKAAGEDCDSGGIDTQGCNGSSGAAGCKFPMCGDGQLNVQFTPSGGLAPESCDNPGGGDTTSCNGNNHGLNGPGSCQLFPSCGDGYANDALMEECDTLGGADSATCNGNGQSAKDKNVACKMVRCGDGYKNTKAGEQCEPPGGMDTGGCNGNQAGDVSCHFAVCGDNYTNTKAGEGCDGGIDDTMMCNGAHTGPANVNCQVAKCGDGYMNQASGEECDPGKSGEDTHDCNGTKAPPGKECKTPSCGDGYVNRAADEQCERNSDCQSSDFHCDMCQCVHN